MQDDLENGDATPSREEQHDEHEWQWMTEDYQTNDDGESTTVKNWYKCSNCDESKVETKQLPFVVGSTANGVIPRKRGF